MKHLIGPVLLGVAASALAQQPRPGETRRPDMETSTPPFRVPNGLNPCVRGMCPPSVVPKDLYIFKQPSIAPNVGSVSPGLEKKRLVSRRVFVSNACHEEIRLAISYYTDQGAWKNSGWWRIAPNASWRLATNKDGSIMSNNPVFYLFASSPTYKWEGSFKEQVGSTEVGMLEATLPTDVDGDWHMQLYCKAGS